MKRSPVKRRNPGRRKREFERAYHSAERVAWVKRRPCVVSDRSFLCAGQIQNMHITGDGAGRKAAYDKIVPCCAYHHALMHQQGIATFSANYDLNLTALAEATELAWRAHRGDVRQEGR